MTEHGQDVQMFINDQHGQIIGLGQVARPGEQNSIAAGRTFETGAAARPGGLGTARRCVVLHETNGGHTRYRLIFGSTPLPFKISVTNRCISVFPVM